MSRLTGEWRAVSERGKVRRFAVDHHEVPGVSGVHLYVEKRRGEFVLPSTADARGIRQAIGEFFPCSEIRAPGEPTTAERLADAESELERLGGRVKELRARVEELEAEVKHRTERERYFASVLGVPDGGQYRHDWKPALERVRDSLASVTPFTALEALRCAQGWQATMPTLAEIEAHAEAHPYGVDDPTNNDPDPEMVGGLWATRDAMGVAIVELYRGRRCQPWISFAGPAQVLRMDCGELWAWSADERIEGWLRLTADARPVTG